MSREENKYALHDAGSVNTTQVGQKKNYVSKAKHQNSILSTQTEDHVLEIFHDVEEVVIYVGAVFKLDLDAIEI